VIQITRNRDNDTAAGYKNPDICETAASRIALYLGTEKMQALDRVELLCPGSGWHLCPEWELDTHFPL